MPLDAAAGLFNEVDANHDGKIDQKEFSQWARGGRNGGVTSPSSKTIKGDFSKVSHGSVDYGTDASFYAGANAVSDQRNLNRNNIIERSEFNQVGHDSSIVVDTLSTAKYVSKYRIDSRGFFLDPNPEIITRSNPGPAPTYKQTIAIRYLKPPPLPPMGENIIREVRAPPLQAPPPFVIREPGKPGSQPPPLILRERPPEPPPPTRSVEKTVMIPPLPAPPQSTIIEKFPDLPDRPRDIILERWLPYEPRPPTRTVRIPAASGPLPEPLHNRIIQYEPLQALIVREFKRIGVTRADPQAYIQQYGGSLLDSIIFVQQARAVGVVEDISLPAGAVVSFASSSHDQAVGLTGSFLGDANGNIITGSSEYSRLVGSDDVFDGYTSSERITRGSEFATGFDVAGTTVRSNEITSEAELRGSARQRF